MADALPHPVAPEELAVAHPIVRRCPSCGEPAAVVMRDWSGSRMFGLVQSGSTGQLDWVCQSCGRGFRTRPRGIRILVGLLFLPFFICGPVGGILTFLDGFDVEALLFTLVLGLVGAVAVVIWAWPFLLLLRARKIADAPYPEVRYTLTEPARRCTCGGVATCTKVTETRTLGIRSGTEYEYRCHSCGEQFTIEDGLGMGLSFLVGGVFVIVSAIALPYTFHDWCLLSGDIIAFCIGLLAASMAVVRFLNRFRHPEIGAEEVGESAG